jgi:arylsulfatase A-like enzyme
MTPPNVVLVVMDTARADVVSIGAEQTPMPWLSEFASEGTVFTEARSNAPWTLPSHGTLFSGQHPSTHGAHAHHKSFDYGPTLAELLSATGYTTVGISNNTWVSGEFGFDRGFDEFLTTWQLYQSSVDFGGVARRRSGALETLKGVLEEFRGNPLKNVANLVYGNFLRKRYDDGARRTNRLVEERLDDWVERSPLFLFVNYLEPHLEYRPPDDFAREDLPEGVTLGEAREVNQDAWAYITGTAEMSERDFEILRALYRAELRYLDTRLRELYEAFESREMADETLFVITGDHGENIGDHGLMDHQYSLHETLLHVPLVIRGEGFDAAPVECPVQGVDVFPTILDVAGAEIPEGLPGVSIRDGAPGDTRETFAEYAGPQPSVSTLKDRYDCRNDVEEFDRGLRAVVTPEGKFVRGTDGTEWFDDWGTGDGRSENRRDELREKLDEWEARQPPIERDTVSMDDSTRARLEDLGYLQ